MDFKQCNTCDIEKDVSRFDRRSRKCRDCINKERRNKRAEDPEKFQQQEKIWRDKNPEKTKANDKRNYEKNKDKKLTGMKDWREANPNYMIKYRQEYKEELKEKRVVYDANNREQINEYNRNYHHHKMETDPVYALARRARTIFNNFLKSKNLYKSENTFNFIRISKELYAEWIIMNFELDNLKLDNCHIDHFIPLSSFKFKKEEDIYTSKCHHWTNLRPMLPEENLEKSNTLPSKNEIFKMDLRIMIFKLRNNL